MKKEDLDRFIEEIKKDDSKSYTITPRQLINAFGWERRTINCQHRIDAYLEEHMMELEPSYIDSWVDGSIVLRHKKKAKTKSEKDPIKKIMILEAANKKPLTVTSESSLQEAITLMMLNDFSQLPVMSGERNPIGYISWDTIGIALANCVKSTIVKDYMKKNIQLLTQDTPLLDAINIICNNNFVVVIRSDKIPCGIVTAADITSQFLKITEPFLLLEQIENHIRQMLDGKILEDDLKLISEKDSTKKSINYIDDLNFGEYIRLMENCKIWSKIGLQVDRVAFITRLNKIREVRNDIMHFEPDGITEEQLNELKNMSSFLHEISMVMSKIN